VQAERHAEAYFANTAASPELYAHMPLGPFTTKAEFVEEFLEKMSGQNPEWLTFAVIDKTRPPSSADEEGELAGMMTFMNTSIKHLSTEIGCIVVLPQYHRTHVTTNAVGLMLQFALSGHMGGGMGLRRVQWTASSMNAASIRVAERLGFQREGLLRWHYVFRNGLQTGKIGNGRALPQGSPENDLGRDTVVLSLCWDDWQNGAKDVVQKAMDRTK
jgi:RimJ/RimL family protein N-acetyltransferase